MLDNDAHQWVPFVSRKPRRAWQFYMVMAGAMVVGLILDFAGLDAVKMLFWSA
jgi:hypothetical protein